MSQAQKNQNSTPSKNPQSKENDKSNPGKDKKPGAPKDQDKKNK